MDLTGTGGKEEGPADPVTQLPTGAKPILYTKVTDDDVLLGRGKRSYNHEGNIRFRKFVLELAEAYSNNDNKAYRKALAQQVINRIASNGGKFLRPVEDEEGQASGMFESVPPPIVRTKVKQALRDMAAGMNASKKGASVTKSGNHTDWQNNIFPPTAMPLGHSFPPVLPVTVPFLGTFPMQLGSSFPTIGATHPDTEYTRLLQLTALQQRIQEREQTAMLMNMLEQQRTLQMAQLIEQQRAGSQGNELTPEQQELLRGLRTGALQGVDSSTLLGNSFPSDLTTANGVGMAGNHFLSLGNPHGQLFPSFANVPSQLSGQVQQTFPSFSGIGQGNSMQQSQLLTDLSAAQAAQNIPRSELGVHNAMEQPPVNAATLIQPQGDASTQGFARTTTTATAIPEGTDECSPTPNGSQKIEEEESSEAASLASNKGETDTGISSSANGATSV